MASSSSSSPIGYAAPVGQQHLVGTFINPQPITKKGIVQYNPRMVYICRTKRGEEPVFIAVAEKLKGVAIKTIYEKVSTNPDKPPSRYLGKIGSSRGVFADDVSTYRTITRRKINFETILEKLAYDLYQELGRGLVQVPKTYLSRQPILDSFTKTQFKALVLAGTPQDFADAGFRTNEALPPEYRLSNESIRVMSRYYTENEYQDFTKADTRDLEGVTISFVKFIERYHRPPTELLSPSGNFVPLRGFIALLALGRLLADTDLLGGTGDNAGFTWVKDTAENFIAAETVKIDPGMAFQFETEHNWAYNTHHRRSGVRHISDSKNIQVANNNDSLTIHWQRFSLEQKTEFVEVLFNSSRYLNTPNVLDFLFYREGRFNRSELEQISREEADRYRGQMIGWLNLQLEIYGEELAQFKWDYPTQVIRTHYIDHWGELPLPASDETFPIRELFTQLTLIELEERKSTLEEEKGNERQETSSIGPELPERDSLFETFQRMDHSGKVISFETLFEGEAARQRLRKVLLIGRAGIGKSTLCQKIAHDWGSGRLWNDCYRHVYWLALRELNPLVEEGGYLHGKTGDFWLAETVARLILKDVDLTSAVLQQIQTDRQTTLILLDGYDEASPRLIEVLASILSDPEFTVLLTSRPGVTQHLHGQMDRLVENIGFSEAHIDRYLNHFFSRKQEIFPLQTPSPSSSSKSPIEKKEAFLEAIRADTNLFVVARIPLQLQMLATLWERGGDRIGFPSTLTGLYGEMIEHLFAWQLRRAGKDPQAVSGFDKTKLLALLGEIGLIALESGRLIFPRNLIAPILDNATTTISEKDLLDSGLIRATGQGIAREYCFLHLTFQEYLIAHAISRKEEKERNHWIVEYRYRPQFQLVMAFLAGIIHRSDLPCLKNTKDFFEVLHTPPGNLSGVHQQALMLRCLNECQNAELEGWIEQRFCLYEMYSMLCLKQDYHNGNFDETQRMARILFLYPKILSDMKRRLIIQASEKDSLRRWLIFWSIDCWKDPQLFDEFINSLKISIYEFITVADELIASERRVPPSGHSMRRISSLTLCLKGLSDQFERLNTSQLEKLKAVILTELSSTIRFVMGMRGPLLRFNIKEEGRDESEVRNYWNAIKGIDDYECKDMFESFPEYAQFFLETIKESFLEFVQDDEEYFLVYPGDKVEDPRLSSFIYLINQIDNASIEEISTNMIEKFFNTLINFEIINDIYFSKFLELFPLLVIRLSNSQVSALIDRLFTYLNDIELRMDDRIYITRTLNMIANNIPNEADAIIKSFITVLKLSFTISSSATDSAKSEYFNARRNSSVLYPPPWHINQIDINLLVSLNLSEDQLSSIIDWSYGSSARLSSFPPIDRSPKSVNFVCRNYKRLVKDSDMESVIKWIWEADSDMALPIIRLLIRESLEKDIKDKTCFLRSLSRIFFPFNSYGDCMASERSSSAMDSERFLSDVLTPISIMWKQILTYWQEQLHQSVNTQLFYPCCSASDHPIGSLLGHDRALSKLSVVLRKAFPDLYTSWIDFLSDFLTRYSLEDCLKYVVLIPQELSFEEAEKLADSIFSKYFNEPTASLSRYNFDLLLSCRIETIFSPRYRFVPTDIILRLARRPLPIHIFLNLDDQSTGRKYDVLVERFFRNDAQLFLLNLEGTPTGCWVEDNKETRISYEHFCALQQRILVSHPLRTYIASYQANNARDLIFFHRWLNQRFGNGWRISLSDNREQLFITREDRNVHLLRRARGALEDFADDLTSKLDSKEGKLVIGGTSEEINQFLDRLEEDYSTSRPASSVPSEATSSS